MSNFWTHTCDVVTKQGEAAGDSQPVRKGQDCPRCGAVFVPASADRKLGLMDLPTTLKALKAIAMYLEEDGEQGMAEVVLRMYDVCQTKLEECQRKPS